MPSIRKNITFLPVHFNFAKEYAISDDESGTVTLGGSDELYSSTAEVRDFNWISGEAPSEPIRCTAKIRYRQPEQPATAIAHKGGSVTLHFDAPQRAVTPGQAAVLYDGNTVLGGGEIVK